MPIVPEALLNSQIIIQGLGILNGLRPTLPSRWKLPEFGQNLSVQWNMQQRLGLRRDQTQAPMIPLEKAEHFLSDPEVATIMLTKDLGKATHFLNREVVVALLRCR